MNEAIEDINLQIKSLKDVIDSLILIVAELEERLFKLESRSIPGEPYHE